MPTDPAKVRDVAARAGVAAASLVAGVTPRRVYQILGVRKPKPRVTDAQRAEIARLRGLGRPTREVARVVGVSRNVVLRTAPAAEPKASEAWSATDVEHVRSRMDAHSAGTIARELERSRSSVDTLIARLRREQRVAEHRAKSRRRKS